MNEQITIREKLIIAIGLLLIKMIGKYTLSEDLKTMVAKIDELTK